MKTWMFALLGLLLWTAAGCHSVDQTTRDAWAQEDRRREDEIYRLRYRVEELEDELTAAKQSGKDSRRKDNDDWRGSARKDSNDAAPPDSPETELPSSSEKSVPDALKPRGNRGSVKAMGERRSYSAEPTGVITEAGLAKIPQYRPSGDSRRVAAIVLDHSMTGGIGAPDGSGDVGVLAVIEPRDKTGRVIDAPGAVEVTLMDPAVKTGDAHAGFWKFNASETAGCFRRGASNGAIYLGMAWPSLPPKHRNLQLFVRYTTADGRRLEANQPIEIALPGEKTARWTSRESDEQVGEERVVSDRRIDDPSRDSSEPRRLRELERDSDEPAYRTASRDSAPMDSERPVWSPERR